MQHDYFGGMSEELPEDLYRSPVYKESNEMPVSPS